MSDNRLTHFFVSDNGLTLKNTATGDNKPSILTLASGETDIAANDVIGAINFQAPDEGTGTDAILVCAGIEAVSEGDFASDNNATKLSFKTGSSETATEKMYVGSNKVVIPSTGYNYMFRVDDDTTNNFHYIAMGHVNNNAPNGLIDMRNIGNETQPLLYIANSAVGQNAAQISGNNTTGNMLDILGNSMTTGSLISAYDGSNDTNGRDIVSISQDNASATNATALYIASSGGHTGVSINKDYSNTSGANVYGINLDLDKTGASTSNNNIYGLNIDLDNTTATDGVNNMIGLKLTPTLTHAADAGTPTVKGAVITATGGTNGTATSTGMELTSTGADTNLGLVINCADGGTDLKIVSSADTGDYSSITTTANGATTLATIDDDGTNANLTLDVDGTIIMNSKDNANNALSIDGATATIHTLGVTGLASLDGGIDVDGAFTVADASGNVSTTGTLQAAATTFTSDTDGEFVALKLVNESDANNTTGIVSLEFDLEDTSGTAVDAGKISVKKNEAFTSTASTQDSNMVFSTSLNGTLTEHVSLSSAGTLTTKHILPDADDTYDLGSAEKRFKDLYLTTASIWLGDEHKISINAEGSFSLGKRNKTVLPKEISDIAGTGSTGLAAINSALGTSYANINLIKTHELLDYYKGTSGNSGKTLVDIYTDGNMGDDFENDFKVGGEITMSSIVDLPASATGQIKVLAVSGPDAAGQNLKITSGAGTGSGAGGSIIFETANAGSSGSSANTPSTKMTLNSDGDLAIFDDRNNADTSLSIGTSSTEALVIQVLNGSTNKTAEEIKFITKTASTTGNHGKMTFAVDENDILEINDSGITVTGALTGNVTGNVTGNASGSALTVTQAAQTAITSVGTLTALQVDNVNINGNTISSTAGTDLNITPLAGQQIVLDGTIVVDAGVVTGATSITSTAFAGALTGNVTGNASGTAATVTTAAQTAITSVGTLTALQVDNINIDGNTISSTAGTDLNITPLAGQQIVLDGTIVVDAGVVTGATSITSTAFAGALTGNVTGNASGTAATVTTAAQTAITSVGTLTALQVDNINIDGNTITSSTAADLIINVTDGQSVVIEGIDIDDGVITMNNGATIVNTDEDTLTITEATTAFAGIVTVSSHLTVSGNLTINGTTTTVNTATLSVEDPLIILASGNGGANTVDIGFYGLYDKTGGQDLYAGLFRDASDSGKFKLFEDLQVVPTNTVDITGAGYAKAILVADIEGNVTGALTGNADTATVATTVTITDNESTNEANAIIFTAGGDVDGGNLGLESDGTLTYNPSTGKITATGFVGALTGDVTGNADTATVATTVTITDNESTNEDNAIIFTAGGDVDGGNLGLESDGTLTYNPSTGKITATGFVGDVTGNADTSTVATTVTITDNESTNEANAIIFTAGGDVDGGNLGLESDGTLTYNPSTGKITATGFVGALTGDVTGNADTATVATTVTITDNESTNEANAIIFTAGGDVDGGNLGLESDGTLTYNPSTGKITATGFVGDVTGNASGTALTVTQAAQGAITSVGTLTGLNVAGDNVTFSSANATDPLVIIKNTTNDTDGARLRFVKDKGAAGANNDYAGLIEFYADDDNQDQVLFAKISAQVADASNGAEGGKLSLGVATHDGEFQNGLVLTDGSVEDEIDVTIGNGVASVTTIAGLLDVTGAVGIGTTSPMNSLQLSHTAADSDNGLMIVREDTSTATNDFLGGIGFDSTDGNVPSSVLEAAAGIGAYASEAHGTGDKGGYLTLWTSSENDNDDTAATERMRITDEGNVGIGTTAPTGKLHISSGNSGDCALVIQADTDNNNETDNPMIIFKQDGAYEPSAICQGNNFLHLKNVGPAAWGHGITFQTAINSSGSYTDAVIRMKINPSGQVGIGDSDSNGISNNAWGGTLLQLESTEPYLTLKNNTAENTNGGCESKIIFEDHSNTALAQIQASHDGTADDTKGDLIFSTHTGSALTEGMRIDSSQNVIIPEGKLMLGSTSVTATATELNLVDTSSAGSIVNSKAVIYGSSGEVNATTLQIAGTQLAFNHLSDCLIETNSLYLGNDPSGTTSTAQYNVGVGVTALNSITSGDNNIAIGYDAGTALTTGESNVAIGLSSLLAVTGGSNNVAIGHRTLRVQNTGIADNVAIGSAAGSALTTGTKCVIIGKDAAGGATTSDNCVVIGEGTCAGTMTGNNNVVIGQASGTALEGGHSNTIIGSASGDELTTGTNNTVIGYNAAASAATVENEVTLGDTNVDTLRCASSVIASTSDRRDKKEIKSSDYGIEFIKKVRPVEFTWAKRNRGESFNGKRRLGFIAQELQAAMPNGENKILDLVYESNPEHLEAKYGNLVPILTKSVQELAEKSAVLEEKSAVLEEENKQLKERLNRLEEMVNKLL